jgi:hypothetical protein
VLEAAAATQFKKILTLVMCQPLSLLAKFRQKAKFKLLFFENDMILEVFNRQK